MRVVRNTFLLLCVLAFASCVRTPQPDPGREPEEEQTPEPEPEPEEPKVKEVPLMAAFTEEFSARQPESFGFTRHDTRPDYRYYSGFPSLSETGKTILMLRIDPSDAAGADRGCILTSRDYTYYGSYSARIRIPDTAGAQPKLGVCADFSLRDDDPEFGLDECTLSFRLADPKNVYLRTLRGDPGTEPRAVESVAAPSVKSFNAASRFYIYGMDWTEGKVVFWMQEKSSSEKTILSECTENVPSQPLRLEFRYYYSKLYPAQGDASTVQAPLYPFELELDWVKYTPAE